MPEFRIRLEFDVEVDNPSFIDAAFAAADQLHEWAMDDVLPNLVYHVAPHDYSHGVTEFQSVDLEEIQADAGPEDDGPAVHETGPWRVTHDPLLPDGRRAAWPFIVKNDDGRINRTNNQTGRVIRFADVQAATGVATDLNMSGA